MSTALPTGSWRITEEVPWHGAPLPGVPRNATTQALSASFVIWTGRARFEGMQGVNNNAAATFVHIYDQATVPSNGAVPRVVIRAAGSDNFSIYFGSLGRWFETGIVVVNSSTLATLTISTADLWVDAQFY